MDLLDLDDHISNLGIDPSAEHLEELFQLFKADFIDNVFYFDGCKVKIDIANSKEEGFEVYPHTFVKKSLQEEIKAKEALIKKELIKFIG